MTSPVVAFVMLKEEEGSTAKSFIFEFDARMTVRVAFVGIVTFTGLSRIVIGIKKVVPWGSSSAAFPTTVY